MCVHVHACVCVCVCVFVCVCVCVCVPCCYFSLFHCLPRYVFVVVDVYIHMSVLMFSRLAETVIASSFRDRLAVLCPSVRFLSLRRTFLLFSCYVAFTVMLYSCFSFSFSLLLGRIFFYFFAIAGRCITRPLCSRWPVIATRYPGTQRTSLLASLNRRCWGQRKWVL